MLVLLTDEARHDLLEAASYYRGVRNRHGNTFTDELEHGLERIAEFPERVSPFGGRFRRFKLRRFPFGILFCEDAGRLIVTAVMHLRMNPQTWKARTLQRQIPPRPE